MFVKDREHAERIYAMMKESGNRPVIRTRRIMAFSLFGYRVIIRNLIKTNELMNDGYIIIGSNNICYGIGKEGGLKKAQEEIQKLSDMERGTAPFIYNVFLLVDGEPHLMNRS